MATASQKARDGKRTRSPVFVHRLKYVLRHSNFPSGHIQKGKVVGWKESEGILSVLSVINQRNDDPGGAGALLVHRPITCQNTHMVGRDHDGFSGVLCG